MSKAKNQSSPGKTPKEGKKPSSVLPFDEEGEPALPANDDPETIPPPEDELENTPPYEPPPPGEGP